MNVVRQDFGELFRDDEFQRGFPFAIERKRRALRERGFKQQRSGRFRNCLSVTRIRDAAGLRVAQFFADRVGVAAVG